MYLIELQIAKYTILDTTQRQVAMGYIMEDMNIHGILVGEQIFREKVIIPNASLPIPINEEMHLVRLMVGLFVAWPQSLVLMDDDQQQPMRKLAPKKRKKGQ